MSAKRTANGSQQFQSRLAAKQYGAPNGPFCFVIMPFGKKGTASENHYDQVYAHIIKRALDRAGLACRRADEIPTAGPVPEAVKQQLRRADLVLADLSDRNPNVFYELGFRHALGKPSIAVCDDVSTLPFNLATYGTIQYSLTNVTEAAHAEDKIIESAHKALEDLRARRTVKSPEEINLPLLIQGFKASLDQGFSNVYQLVGEQVPVQQQEALLKDVHEHKALLTDISSKLDSVQQAATAMVTASRLLQQTGELGLVSIHPSRSDAIEDEFFAIMEHEDQGIDVVASTIFGLKGRHRVTRDTILNLLRAKAQRNEFTLRVLLTHWDFISHRQDQEKTEKNVTRYVISKELKEAVDLLVASELAGFVRFYRGAPTCFTVICRGEGLMLANPYPYQREAYNSWTAVFRQTSKPGIFSAFGKAHFEEPWGNHALTIPFGKECVTAVVAKLQQDLRQAQEDIATEYEKDAAR
jgi:hypothetical protein